MPQLFDDLFYIPPDVGDLQRTDAVAAALADLLTSAGNAEGITFTKTFIPEFDPKDMPAPKALVFPAALSLVRVSRTKFTEDNTVQIGIGRKITNETTDVETQLKTVEEVIGILKAPENAIIAIGDESVTFLTIETTLYVPELLRKRVALSVISYVYRGFS